MSLTVEHPLFLTIQETAALFRVEARTIRNWVAAGRLPAKRVIGSRGLLISREVALTLLEEVAAPVSHGPLAVTPQTGTSGIIRRTRTPEGRARALAALDSLLDGDETEQETAGEHLQELRHESGVRFRRNHCCHD